ncbi:hypothetical protein P7K49_008520 [Saguinus oedipus]|uniref:Uncharacterized protein n=1 Tax=Saguinus oedipus TaxID=9490 RepID=A0ABQ9VXY7_SAGOE|nr:hypothetical protein P7K49_008520 [Saguinus oedipus]
MCKKEEATKTHLIPDRIMEDGHQEALQEKQVKSIIFMAPVLLRRLVDEEVIQRAPLSILSGSSGWQIPPEITQCTSPSSGVGMLGEDNLALPVSSAHTAVACWEENGLSFRAQH